MYALMEDLVEKYHEDLREARIGLAWCTSWRPDVDGRVTIGKCRKASDLDRELQAFDFIILLSKSYWLSLDVTNESRRALLDHELSHAAVKYDDKGEPVYDERGRKVYRTRRHDIEEFTGVVRRHGIYKRDLEQFAQALRRDASKPFTPCDACKETPGFVAVVEENVPKVARCACWMKWAEQHELQLQSA